MARKLVDYFERERRNEQDRISAAIARLNVINQSIPQIRDNLISVAGLAKTINPLREYERYLSLYSTGMVADKENVIAEHARTRVKLERFIQNFLFLADTNHADVSPHVAHGILIITKMATQFGMTYHLGKQLTNCLVIARLSQ